MQPFRRLAVAQKRLLPRSGQPLHWPGHSHRNHPWAVHDSGRPNDIETRGLHRPLVTLLPDAAFGVWEEDRGDELAADR